MPAIPLIGYAPDADPTTPGILRGGRFLPTKRGIKPYPAFTAYTESGTPSSLSAHGFANGRFFAATGVNELYEFRNTGVWSNVANLTPFNCSGGYFSTFNESVLLTVRGTPINISTGPGVRFTALSATAPSALVVATTANFVVAFNTVDGTYGDSPDRWWCGPINNPQGVWTPSITTQANTGRLIGADGPIVAALPLGEQIVAYKQRAIYVGTYVGSPEVWRWQQVPGEVGADNRFCVVDIGGAHIFWGTNGLWQFDGTRPVRLGAGVAMDSIVKTARATGYAPNQALANITFEATERIVYFKPVFVEDIAYAYEVDAQRFGLLFVGGAGRLSIVGRPYALNPTVNPLQPVLGVIPAFTVPQYRAPGGESSIEFTTGAYGSPSQETMVYGVRVIGDVFDTTAGSVGGSSGPTQNVFAPTDGPSSASSVQSAGGRFDMRQTGRWHSFGFGLGSVGEVTAIEVEAKPAGRR